MSKDQPVEGPTPGPWEHEDIVAELSFVIGERRATIGSIRRERKESEKLKAIRIAICEKMIGRTQAARAMVEAYPDLLEALREIQQLDRTAFASDLSWGRRHQELARSAISKALGQGVER